MFDIGQPILRVLLVSFNSDRDEMVNFNKTTRSRDSSVGIANGYGLDDQGAGVRVPVGSKIFTSPYRPDRLRVHPTSYKMGTGGFFLGG
jgi:hypothetical protein